MAKNFVQPGHVVTLTAAAAVSSGDLVVVGDLAGIVTGDAPTGEDMEVGVTGVWDVPAEAADTFAEGDPVFEAGGLATSVVAGAPIGYAVSAKVGGADTVRTLLVQGA